MTLVFLCGMGDLWQRTTEMIVTYDFFHLQQLTESHMKTICLDLEGLVNLHKNALLAWS